MAVVLSVFAVACGSAEGPTESGSTSGSEAKASEAEAYYYYSCSGRTNVPCSFEEMTKIMASASYDSSKHSFTNADSENCTVTVVSVPKIGAAKN